tara:strand:- start:277 stop:459 length:183 start_codon:yes stop_codon:yes gene_type:complete
MPYHTGSKKQEPKPKKKVEKKKELKVYNKKPANSHLMNGNIIMSGKTHSKNSKVLGKLKK